MAKSRTSFNSKTAKKMGSRGGKKLLEKYGRDYFRRLRKKVSKQ